MFVIGLTGGIASGKSTAASYLRELGAEVIDADLLGHRIYEPGTRGFENVVRAFGDDIVAEDGTIDRRVLGGKVFGKPEELQRLTDIVWPLIRELAEHEIEQIGASDPDRVIVLEAAVLLEAQWDDLADEVWVVVVDQSVAIERLVERNGMSREDAMARIRSQLSNRERLERSDRAIDNSASPDELRNALRLEWDRLATRHAQEQTNEAAAKAKP